MRHLDRFTSILRNVRTLVLGIGKIPSFLLFLWLCAVWWGEQSVFNSHVHDCTWENWETWKDGSNPHRVLLIADPQLVDPHTYPDRPWPLSSLTIVYTDLYLKRTYQRLLDQLQPDSILFLGDLFDGGREWGTSKYKSPDQQYRQYGQDFWLGEYQRFQDMFVKPWDEYGMARFPAEGGRRLITSLPGNHDLGFAGGINLQVRTRFDAHFGPTNRIDMIGNHTFVSLDTVSLSAMDQVDLETGASGAGDKSATANKNSKIWQPVQTFLDDASAARERRVKQEIRSLSYHSSNSKLRKEAAKFRPKFVHEIASTKDLTADKHVKTVDPLKSSSSRFPTILLSHVPLYRSDTDNCGPYRERGTSIPISAGYQYQNVLTPLISKDIVDKLGADQIAMIYSGDDHDYCEIEHDEFTGRIKEITVKSMSWAMGIRKPGVQLVSLWNPVDLEEAYSTSTVDTEDDSKLHNPTSRPRNTVQNHLCLLPDQLAIFIRYGKLLALTLIALIVRATRWKKPTTSPPSQRDLEKATPLLPLSNNPRDPSSKRSSSPPPNSHAQAYSHPQYNHHDDSSITSRKPTFLNTYGQIPASARSRTPSPSKLKSATSAAGFTSDSDDWGMPTTHSDRAVYAHAHQYPDGTAGSARGGGRAEYMRRLWLFRRSRSKVEAFVKSVLFIALPVLGSYVWLVRRDM